MNLYHIVDKVKKILTFIKFLSIINIGNDKPHMWSCQDKDLKINH